jgi:hypothetical protein
MMLIILQNKLIYLPYIPFGARQETIQEYSPQLLGFDWTTTEVRTRDGKKLVACVSEIRFLVPPVPAIPLTALQKANQHIGNGPRVFSGVPLFDNNRLARIDSGGTHHLCRQGSRSFPGSCVHCGTISDWAIRMFP